MLVCRGPCDRRAVHEAGGTSYAGEKIERWGSAGTAEEREGLEPGEWEIAPGISVQGLRGGVWEHDAGGAGGGVDEPSSGMVQCVEQGGDRLEHAQREGDQRLRFYAGGEDRRDFWGLGVRCSFYPLEDKNGGL